MKFLLLATIFCISSVAVTQAQPTYAYANPAASSNNIYPFQDNTNNKVQWIYVPTQFTPALPASGMITKVYFQVWTTNATNISYTNLTIKMASTALTAFPSTAWITGLTTVYTAPTTLIPSVTPSGWVSFQLTTPILITNSSNFILEVSQTAYVGGFNIWHGALANIRLYGNVAGVTASGISSGPSAFGFDMAPACTGTPTAPVITTAPLTFPICPNGTTSITATNTGAPTGITYQWEQAPLSTGPWTSVVGGVGATTLSYTTASLAATTWFRCTAICGTNTAPSTPYQVQVAPTSQPGPITGPTVICLGSTQTYSVAPVTGATSYTWTLPSGWSGSSTTNSISTVAGSPGNITVTATGPCGTSTAQTLAVTGGALPPQPAAITGNATFCAGTAQPYSVPIVPGATTYNWVLPSGWTGTSTTNTINTTAGAAGGTISVSVTNSCGTSIPQTLAVTPTTLPPVLGPIIGNTPVCNGSIQTYSVTPVSSVINYTWTIPSGWSGTSTTNSIPVVAGSTGGTITVIANNGCGLSTPKTLAVSVNPLVAPSVSITGSPNPICPGTSVVFTAVPVNGGPTPSFEWRRNGVIVGSNAPTYNSGTIGNADVITVMLIGSDLCATVPTANSNPITITVNPGVMPVINIAPNTPTTICAGTAVTFSAATTGGGTTPGYQWSKNGNPITGATSATYSDNGLANGDSISCILTTNAPCALSPTAQSPSIGMTVKPLLTPGVTVTSSTGTNYSAGELVVFTATVTNGGTIPGFQWMKNGVPIFGETLSTYTTQSLANGDQISVQLTSTAPCASPVVKLSNTLVMNQTTGIGSVPGNITLSLAPNPNRGHFTLSADWEDLAAGSRIRIEVLSSLGQVVYFTEIAPGRSKWSMDINLGDNIANGLYLMRLSAEGAQGLKRFQVNR